MNDREFRIQFLDDAVRDHRACIAAYDHALRKNAHRLSAAQRNELFMMLMHKTALIHNANVELQQLQGHI